MSYRASMCEHRVVTSMLDWALEALMQDLLVYKRNRCSPLLLYLYICPFCPEKPCSSEEEDDQPRRGISLPRYRSRKYCPFVWRERKKKRNLPMYRKHINPQLPSKQTHPSNDIRKTPLTSKDKASHSLSPPQPNPPPDGNAQQPEQQ